MKSEKKVLVIVGMPGAGKGVASSAAQELNCPVFVCGDVIREETERRGLAPTPENVGDVMLRVRDEEGPAIVAKRLVPKIEEEHSSIVIVEGARNMEEVDTLRGKHRVLTVAIHASPITRFERLVARGRSDDPKRWEEFTDRDERELRVGLGRVIALADEMLVNEGTIQELKDNFKRVLKRVQRT